MHIVLSLVGLLIAAFFRYKYEEACRREGSPILSRRQMRYQRRKARKQGVSVDAVSYRPKREHAFFFPVQDPTSLPIIAPTQPLLPSPAKAPTSNRAVWWLLGPLTLAGALLVAVVSNERDTPQTAVAQQAQQATTAVAAPRNPPASAEQKRRTARAVNVRALPGNNGAVLRTLAANAEFVVVETAGDWARVAVNGEPPIGWVYLPITR